MSVKSCEKLEKSQVALTIEVGAQEFEAAIEKAYQNGGAIVRGMGIRVESLARIACMSVENGVEFCKD